MGSRNNRTPRIEEIKHGDDELMIIEGGQIVVHFAGSNDRNKLVMGTYKVGSHDRKIVFWGPTNSLPDERELLIANNNIVPQLLATKRNIILGGGLMAYTERFEDGERIKEEIEMPGRFTEFMDEHEVEDEYLVEAANQLLTHGNVYTQFTRNGGGNITSIRLHPSRYVRAEAQNTTGKIPNYWLYGQWGKITDQQKIKDTKELTQVPAYMKGEEQPSFMLHCADKMIGGPYYFSPHWEGSLIWIKLANCIPEFHLANLENGFNIRYVIKVPEDYFFKSLSEEKRKEEDKLKMHISQAKLAFKNKLNEFLAGASNSGRALIVTKHFYKHLQQEWPELEIQPLEVDLKDEAMLKLFESSNTAMTSAHGIPPSLAGIATGVKLSSGSEIRNLYNFFQMSGAPMPRRILLKPLKLAWREMGMPDWIKLGFRNIEMQTTDKEPTGITQPIPSPE